MSSKYLESTIARNAAIEREAKENPSAHRRMICRNYLEHAALEHSERWGEIFTPERTVDHPVYQIKWGTPETVVYNGLEQVTGLYEVLAKGGVLTAHDELFSLGDWGFSSFMTMNAFSTGQQLLDRGVHADDPSADYIFSTRCAMYWLYDENALLIGENIFELEPGAVTRIAPEDVVTEDDALTIYERYMPHGREVGASAAFSGS